MELALARVAGEWLFDRRERLEKHDREGIAFLWLHLSEIESILRGFDVLDAGGALTAEEASVHAMDRRGRGASGDGPDYDMAREFEDVAAVVDAVAEASGSAVDLYGHSFGGSCALGGATLTTSVRSLAVYEPAGESHSGRLPAGDVGAAGRAIGRRQARGGRRGGLP